MPGRMAGKVALVTGGSSGIGRAAAQLFARESAKVAIADINVEGGEKTARMIKADGGEAFFIKTDISRSEEVKVLVNKIVETYGQLDCAFNNAGIFGDIAPLVEYSEETWDHVIGNNLKGTFLCLKYEISQMLKQGSGAIVNMSSIIGATVGAPGLSAHSATKAGIVGLTKVAALEYAEYGIRINVISPGATRAPQMENIFNLNPELEADMITQTPMGRIGNPEDIAEAALWLCSDAASFVTGHTLIADGGYSTR